MRIPSLAASTLALVALLAAGAPALTAAPAHAAAARSCMPSSLQAAPVHAAVAPVYFEMQTAERATPFVFQLTDPAKIEHARRILSGEEREEVHVLGRIIKRPAPYNPRWSFHYDPNTISFFAFAIEVCDATVSYTEDHLDEACGAFLPGCVFCPWTSKLVREIPAP
ncbi:calmodulin-binding protein [Nonomuraea sp. NPDC049158]|uniref:BP74-related protein n=1 Tax=Nonomuraea sp. NPDC049158 TaxID=3155649 RepID=UPI0033C4F294